MSTLIFLLIIPLTDIIQSIQVDAPIQSQWIKNLTSIGVELGGDYLPNYPFIIRIFLSTQTLKAMMVYSPPAQITNTITVTNNNDSGVGSLRQAILDANALPGPHRIIFDIPTDDGFYGYEDDGIPGSFDPTNPTVPANTNPDPDGPLWWTIFILTPLPYVLQDYTELDGSSQTVNHGDTNPFGPEIETRGYYIPSMVSLSCDYCAVTGLAIYQNGLTQPAATHLQLFGNFNRIQGNYLGTEPSGRVNYGFVASSLYVVGENNLIGGLMEEDGNLITGGYSDGLFIAGENNQIVGNSCNLNAQRTELIGYSGDCIQALGIDNGVIANNILAGGGIRMVGTSNAVIENNFIGTDPTGELNWGPLSPNAGIYVGGNSTHNLITHNAVKYFGTGISIDQDYGTTDQNTISQNVISENRWGNDEPIGISLLEGANGNMPKPVITEVSAQKVVGTTLPLALVEVFSDRNNQGGIFEGTAQADWHGDFVWYGVVTGPFVTVTATDQDGNTSEFSDPRRGSLIWLPFVVR